MFAYFNKEYVVFIGKKCADLVRRSTIIQMALQPLGEFSNPTTKSIVMCSHFHSGIGSDCSNSTGLGCFALTCWHCRHYDTNSAISFFIPGDQKVSFKS